jgi:predicted transglutaminase-like cysteine proteinase
MSAKAWPQGAAQWLPVLVFFGFVTAAAVVDADATPEAATSQVRITAAVPADADVLSASQAPASATRETFVIALAMQGPARGTIAPPTNIVPPAASIAPLISTAPAPARFFTISDVMARHRNRPQRDAAIQLASTDPTLTATDAAAPPTTSNKGDAPFGLFTFVAPDGQLWTKWRKVADDIRSEEPALTRCLADSKQCSPAAARLGAIINDGRDKTGRARLDLVNNRVNSVITYKSDMAQWGVADLWSAPLAANGTGSFSTGFGDCEDFAIAKYVALRAAGVPARELRVLLVHDNAARMDHAVLAALDDGHWYILDNRWTAAVEDTEVRQFAPLFALDEQGVKLLAVPYAAKAPSKITPMSEVVKADRQIFVPGGNAAEQLPASSRDGVSGTGWAPVLL